MNPKYPRILPDRDRRFKYYLDEDVTIALPEGSSLTVGKGYRFDGHSSKMALAILLVSLPLLVLAVYFPAILILLLKVVTVFGLISSVLVLTVFRAFNKYDIYCALVHDALVDFESMHRYNRAYIDYVYKMYMNSDDYKSNDWRAFFMPLAVSFWGWLRFTLWGDYRGEPKPNTHVSVKVDMV